MNPLAQVVRGLSVNPQPTPVTQAPTLNLFRDVLARADNTSTNTVSASFSFLLVGAV